MGGLSTVGRLSLVGRLCHVRPSLVGRMSPFGEAAPSWGGCPLVRRLPPRAEAVPCETFPCEAFPCEAVPRGEAVPFPLWERLWEEGGGRQDGGERGLG